MHRLIRQSETARGLFVAMMVLVLALRVLVPVGFMPVAQDGRIVVQLCTGTGPATMVLDIGKDKSRPDGEHKNAESPCAFSGGYTGGLIDVAAPVILAPALALLRLVQGAAIADLTVHRLAAPPPPAIGPPANL